MNALRLAEGFDVTLFVERTGLPLAAVDRQLAAAEAKGLIKRDHVRIRPTPLGRRFLNDLLQLFLPGGEVKKIAREVKALTFDVFGTVVDWRGSITGEGRKLGEEKRLRARLGGVRRCLARGLPAGDAQGARGRAAVDEHRRPAPRDPRRLLHDSAIDSSTRRRKISSTAPGTASRHGPIRCAD